VIKFFEYLNLYIFIRNIKVFITKINFLYIFFIFYFKC